MNEKPNPNERTNSLDKATKAVIAVYSADILGAELGLGTQTEAERDKAWEDVAQANPAFGEQIRSLRRRLVMVKEIIKAYAPPTPTLRLLPFMQVINPLAKRMLGDILLSRIAESNNQIDHKIIPIEEATLMANELGIQGGWQSEQARLVTPGGCIRAVLQESLQIVHQPHFRR